MVNSPVFTAIVCTYTRPAMLKEAVAAIRRQTYKNLEIILINNGTDSESIDYLEEVAGIDKRVKLVHFKDNVYTPDDPGRYIDICFNAALEIATGDYIWCQSDDDFIGDDYAERMIALFHDNPECTTAAGIAVSIDGEGKTNGIAHEHPNDRPRYMPGHEMALASALGKSTLFGAPGCIFTVKRDDAILTRNHDLSREKIGPCKHRRFTPARCRIIFGCTYSLNKLCELRFRIEQCGKIYIP